ncbi:MAG: hypothetical protein CG442_1597 [Methylococcaceae bacterium NSO1]|nr:MAG: hypothetical protein CG442_1597 [Methylococcaceae bacterium NSO1]
MEREHNTGNRIRKALGFTLFIPAYALRAVDFTSPPSANDPLLLFADCSDYAPSNFPSKLELDYYQL